MNKKIRHYLLVLTMIGLLVLSIPSLNAQGDGAEGNVRLLIAFHEAEAERNFDRLEALVHLDFVYHSMAATGVGQPQDITGRDQYFDYLRAMAAEFPDYLTEPLMVVTEDEYLAFYSLTSGTSAENGNYVEMPVSGIVRFEDGYMVEMWVEWDNLSWEAQMTADPPTVAEPITSADDLIGEWELWVDGFTVRWEVTSEFEKAHVYRDGIEVISEESPYYVEGSQLHILDGVENCEAIYDAFVIRQPDDTVQGLRFLPVNEDCRPSRQQLRGVVHPWVEE